MIDMYDIKHVKKVRVLDSRNCPIKSEKKQSSYLLSRPFTLGEIIYEHELRLKGHAHTF